jgi:carboxypeptidase C (cathepsin A)
MKIKIKSILALISLFLACVFSSGAQDKNSKASLKPDDHDSLPHAAIEPRKVITQGSVTVEGNRINYQASTGTLILKNDKDKPIIAMFYVAYFKSDDNDASKRPITFLYNGGPGSSTLWLHMGAFGPRRSFTTDTARTIAPYKIVNNDFSLLDASDLVFIDAPGTGFSEILDKDKAGVGEPKDFYGIDPDAQTFAKFIIQFLSAYNRWNSPKYLFGESYGTFRSAVLSNILQSAYATDLNGVILLSQILSYYNMSDVARNNPGMDLPYQLTLPSCAATAWYHHKLSPQPPSLEPFLKEVEEFAMGEYALALGKGAQLDSTAYNHIAEKLHEYTGLPVSYILKANLRISGPEFEQTLLADENLTTGRLDSRFTGPTMDPLSEEPRYDPHGATFEAAFVATFNDYLRTDLKFDGEMRYKTFGDNIEAQWDLQHKAPSSSMKFFANVMPDLAMAMKYNPRLKVMMNMGYFDLGTPFFESIYEMNHLDIPASLQKNIEYNFYNSGHMVYLQTESLKKLHDNVAKFIQSTH